MRSPSSAAILVHSAARFRAPCCVQATRCSLERSRHAHETSSIQLGSLEVSHPWAHESFAMRCHSLHIHSISLFIIRSSYLFFSVVIHVDLWFRHLVVFLSCLIRSVSRCRLYVCKDVSFEIKTDLVSDRKNANTGTRDTIADGDR